MTVLVLENVSESLRGECTRFLLEVKVGVFIGTISALVREKLWGKVKEASGEGNCLIAYPYDNEQGFYMEMYGSPRRTIIDMEGLLLIKSVIE